MVDRDRRSRPRRLADIRRVLAELADDSMPPLSLLFRLSELGIRNPAGIAVPELRRRVDALNGLYEGRAAVERRHARRRRADAGPGSPAGPAR